MRELISVCLGFLRTMRWYLPIKAVGIAGLVSTPAANWIGEVSGLNKRMLEFLESADRREAGSEPPAAL